MNTFFVIKSMAEIRQDTRSYTLTFVIYDAHLLVDEAHSLECAQNLMASRPCAVDDPSCKDGVTDVDELGCGKAVSESGQISEHRCVRTHAEADEAEIERHLYDLTLRCLDDEGVRTHFLKCCFGQLMNACIECAEAAGYEQIELSVVAENEPAIAIYKKAGFVEYGRNPRGFKSRFTGYQELVYMRMEL